MEELFWVPHHKNSHLGRVFDGSSQAMVACNSAEPHFCLNWDYRQYEIPWILTMSIVHFFAI